MSAEQLAYQLKQIATAMNCDATAEAIIKRWEDARKDSARLDWLEKQPELALWQGSWSDSEMNIQLGRAGAPIATVSTMEDGETTGDDIGRGSSIRTAIDAASGEKRGL